MSTEKAKDDERYSLTAKGKLSRLMMETNDIERVWNGLRDFVELQAMREGHARGTPALVFVGGGVCVTMVKEVTETEDTP